MFSIERLIIDSAEGSKLNDEDLKRLLCYPEIDRTRLSAQTAMFHDYLKSLNERHNTEINSFTQMSSICSLLALDGTTTMRVMFSEIYKLLRIYLTCPVSSSTAERTFSTLRRLKTYLRSTMTQKRLNHLLIVSTHKDRANLVNLEGIADMFVSLNANRRGFFGSFH